MRTFWICLVLSLALHLAVFGNVLESLMSTGKASSGVKTPQRVKIRLVKRKKPQPPPKPKVVAVKPKIEKPKPQIKKPAPKPEPKPKPKVAVKPKPIPKAPPPKARPPKPKQPPKTVAKRSYPKSQPVRKAYPKASKPTAQPRKSSTPKRPDSTRRLTRETRPSRPTGGPKPVPVPVSSNQDSGRAGQAPEPADPGNVADNNSTGARPGGDETGGVDNGGGDTSPAPAPAPLPKPKPKPVEPKPAPEPPKPKPKRQATHSSMARPPQISVPNIDPPAKFRREKLKGQLKVRFRIAADGTFQVSLFDSSGNKEFDDFVIEEIRKTASVQPELDEDGKPKRSVTRGRVEINID